MIGSPEGKPDQDLYCRSFKRVATSFHLKNQYCPQAECCEKKLKSCLIVADLMAECEGSRLATPEDVEQELIVQELEAKAGATKH